MPEREPLEFKNADEWRNWFSTHNGTEKEAWVVHYKVASLQKGLRYREALPEAIAYGWIDGKLETIDDDRFMLRYSPRKTNSIWSKRNRLIAEELIKAGKMAPSGLAAVDAAKKDGNWSQAYTNLETLSTPEDLRKALETEKIALENFARFPVSARNMYIRWIEGAKTDTTRQARIKGVVTRAERNVKLGDIASGISSSRRRPIRR
ncbi:YdeI/OmpD-associated family protein [Dehalogenimonas sp. THU2]|uniref:YdeI/OmpD-associated family protein n=1 Tax=Dehalogenimonas sp. THU2 TaxID=3151121 RepID=UPI003218603D